MISTILLLALVGLAASIEAPTEPPFVHPRGVGQSVIKVNSVTLNAADYGLSSSSSGLENQEAFNKALDAMEQGDTLLVPDGVFPMVGGVVGEGLRNNTIVFDGTLEFQPDFDNWPLDPDQKNEKYMDCLAFKDSIDLAFTSSSTGVINGGGRDWWNKMIAGTLPPNNKDSRPKLFHVTHSADILVEKLKLVNSPSWNLIVDAVRAEIRFFEVETDRDYQRELKTNKYRGDAKGRVEEVRSGEESQ